ncbi:ATP-grasp domain-containing protein [Saccharopolyspora griseoalba]|uniref:Acetyl-CoA carboxylase biotin carboxylase subunit family protein n=1 Tax=Saccharopolyspora griseoalba TaxID=1431848 RepID=A0ABW2LQU3_9PSEU
MSATDDPDIAPERPKNVFALGLDERNLDLLREQPHLSGYRFHALLDKDRLMFGDVDLPRLLEVAQQRIDEFREPVDAIVGYWDFPVSSMVPILCTRNGLPGPSLESVVKSEHKYWSRLVQREVTDAHPSFGIVDLDRPEPPPGLNFPMWLKPVKAYSSELALKVHDSSELRSAAEQVHRGIAEVGEAFDFLLSTLELPPEIADIGGVACLAEEAVHGDQITAEGYCHGGRAHVYGIVDSLCYPDSSSFQRYQYPSGVDEELRPRIVDISCAVAERLGLDHTMFNIEFFRDPETEALNILEVNPRLSQSHAPLFELVDGTPNHQAMVQLATGEQPTMPYRSGRHRVAGKWFHRTFEDAHVKSAPGDAELARVREEFPDAFVDLVAQEGKRLSELRAQDPYSYELFAVYLGADSEEDLRAKYLRCVDLLPFVLRRSPQSD